MRRDVSAARRTRSPVGDFSNPIFQFDYTLLVPAGSSIVGIADADRPGVRIAAVRNHASTIELSSQLKQAELVYAETPDSTFDLVRTGHAHVMASTRLALLDFSDRLPGSRVLADRYGANINRMVVPKGKADWLAYVSEFVENAKASGLVRRPSSFASRSITRSPTGTASTSRPRRRLSYAPAARHFDPRTSAFYHDVRRTRIAIQLGREA